MPQIKHFKILNLWISSTINYLRSFWPKPSRSKSTANSNPLTLKTKYFRRKCLCLLEWMSQSEWSSLVPCATWTIKSCADVLSAANSVANHAVRVRDPTPNRWYSIRMSWKREESVNFVIASSWCICIRRIMWTVLYRWRKTLSLKSPPTKWECSKLRLSTASWLE